METEHEDYVIIAKHEGLVIMNAGLTNREVYETRLRLYSKNHILYTKYGLGKDENEYVIEALDQIHGRPHSEVQEKVDGLIAKLKGEI